MSTELNKNHDLRIKKLKDQGKERELQDKTSAECLQMMWQLALDAWAFKEENFAESRLPRHVVQLVRRKS